jgi:hypothetical protein
LLPGGSGYFTCIQNMRSVANKFNSGGLHEKHVVATWNQLTTIHTRQLTTIHTRQLTTIHTRQLTTIHTRQLTTVHARHLKIPYVQNINNTKVRN